MMKLECFRESVCFVAGRRITLRTDRCIGRIMPRCTSAARDGRSSTARLDVCTVSTFHSYISHTVRFNSV